MGCLNGINEYVSDGTSYWHSISPFTPVQNTSYGSIELKTALHMELDIYFYDHTLSTGFENLFRIGHPGYSVNDQACDLNDRFPAMWIDAETNSFLIDISDQGKGGCYRRYAQNYVIEPQTQYSVVIDYNSTWVYISINNVTITNQPRSDKTHLYKLNTKVEIYISTHTVIGANVQLSNIRIESYDDNSITSPPTLQPSISPTNYPSFQPSLTPSNAPSVHPTNAPTSKPTQEPTKYPTISPSIMPTYNPTMIPSIYPTMDPTVSKAPTPETTKSPTKRPTTYLPTIETLQPTRITTESSSIMTDNGLFDSSTTDYIFPFNTDHTKDDILSTLETQQDELKTSSKDKPEVIVSTMSHNEILNGTSFGTDYYKNSSISFEIIFYILTGCAMGGILFCVCTCCCFGCVINKKIKTLADDDTSNSNNNKRKKRTNSASNVLSMSNFYRSDDDKVIVRPLSRRNDGDSFDSTTPIQQPGMDISPSDEEFINNHHLLNTSPKSERMSSPSGGTIPSSHPSTHSTPISNHNHNNSSSSDSDDSRTKITKNTQETVIDLTRSNRGNSYNRSVHHAMNLNGTVRNNYQLRKHSRKLSRHRSHNHHHKQRNCKRRMAKSVPIMDVNSSADRKIKIKRHNHHKLGKSHSHKQPQRRSPKRHKTRTESTEIALAMEYVDTSATETDQDQEREKEDTDNSDINGDKEEQRHSIISPLGGDMPKMPGYDGYLERQHFYENRKINGKINPNDAVPAAITEREDSYTNTISQTLTTLTNQKQLILAPNSSGPGANGNGTIFSNPSTHYSLCVQKPGSPIMPHPQSLLETDEDDEDDSSITEQDDDEKSNGSTTENEDAQLVQHSIDIHDENDLDQDDLDDDDDGNSSITTEESRMKHDRKPSKQYQIQIDYANTVNSSNTNDTNDTDHEQMYSTTARTMTNSSPSPKYGANTNNTKSVSTPNGESDLVDEVIEFENEYYQHDIKNVRDSLKSLNQHGIDKLKHGQTDDSSTNDEEDEDMKQQQQQDDLSTNNDQDDDDDDDDDDEEYVTKHMNIITIGDGTDGIHTKSIDDAVNEIEEDEHTDNQQLKSPHLENKEKDEILLSYHEKDKSHSVDNIAISLHNQHSTRTTAAAFLQLPNQDSGATELSNMSGISNNSSSSFQSSSTSNSNSSSSSSSSSSSTSSKSTVISSSTTSESSSGSSSSSSRSRSRSSSSGKSSIGSRSGYQINPIQYQHKILNSYNLANHNQRYQGSSNKIKLNAINLKRINVNMHDICDFNKSNKYNNNHNYNDGLPDDQGSQTSGSSDYYRNSPASEF